MVLLDNFHILLTSLGCLAMCVIICHFHIPLTSLGCLAMCVIICHYPSRLSLAFEILVWSLHQNRLQTEGFEV